MLQVIVKLFQINPVLFNFLFIKESWKKCIMLSTKILSRPTVFKTGNNKNEQQTMNLLSENSNKTVLLNQNNTSQYNFIIDQISTVSVSIRDFCQKTF